MRVKNVSFLSRHVCTFDLNISATGQNFKTLVSNLQDIEMRNLIVKFELCSFNAEGVFHMTDRQTLKNNSTLVASTV